MSASLVAASTGAPQGAMISDKQEDPAHLLMIEIGLRTGAV